MWSWVVCGMVYISERANHQTKISLYRDCISFVHELYCHKTQELPQIKASWPENSRSGTFTFLWSAVIGNFALVSMFAAKCWSVFVSVPPVFVMLLGCHANTKRKTDAIQRAVSPLLFLKPTISVVIDTPQQTYRVWWSLFSRCATLKSRSRIMNTELANIPCIDVADAWLDQ